MCSICRIYHVIVRLLLRMLGKQNESFYKCMLSFSWQNNSNSFKVKPWYPWTQVQTRMLIYFWFKRREILFANLPIWMSKGFINKSQYLHMFFWRRPCFTFLIFFNLRIRSKYVFGSLTKNPWFLYILHIIILYLWSLSNLSDVILNYTLIRTKTAV